MVFNKTVVLALTALAGTAAALLVSGRRRIERAEALEDRVRVQDWESMPLRGTVPGAQVPAPQQVAREVTGVAP
jgi:hypothetical protein